MQTTKDRVWAKIATLKKPQRRKIVKVTKPKRVRHVPSKLEKYATSKPINMRALPDLLIY